MRLNFENRLVALIDVMGFKSLLGGNETNIAKLELYYETALEAISDIQFEVDFGFQKLFVSDSIVLSIRLTGDKDCDLIRSSKFFGTIGEMQYKLAIKGLTWTRGAVSIGPLCIDESSNIMVGKSFVQAYELEKLSDYPRVIIDPKVIGYFGLYLHEFVTKINQLDTSRYILMGPDDRSILGSAFKLEATIIDWFSNNFASPLDSSGFFADLKDRQVTDQQLLSKSRSLIGYIGKSALRYYGLNKELILKDSAIRKKCYEVQNILEQFTGTTMSSLK